MFNWSHCNTIILLVNKTFSIFVRFLVLRDFNCLLPLVVGVVADVLDERVDEGVLVQALGADHHVGLGVAVL